MAPVVAVEQKPPSLPVLGRDLVRNQQPLTAVCPWLGSSSSAQLLPRGLGHRGLGFTTEGQIGSQILTGDANLGRIGITPEVPIRKRLKS